MSVTPYRKPTLTPAPVPVLRTRWELRGDPHNVHMDIRDAAHAYLVVWLAAAVACARCFVLHGMTPMSARWIVTQGVFLGLWALAFVRRVPESERTADRSA